MLFLAIVLSSLLLHISVPQFKFSDVWESRVFRSYCWEVVELPVVGAAHPGGGIGYTDTVR